MGHFRLLIQCYCVRNSVMFSWCLVQTHFCYKMLVIEKAPIQWNLDDFRKSSHRRWHEEIPFRVGHIIHNTIAPHATGSLHVLRQIATRKQDKHKAGAKAITYHTQFSLPPTFEPTSLLSDFHHCTLYSSFSLVHSTFFHSFPPSFLFAATSWDET